MEYEDQSNKKKIIETEMLEEFNWVMKVLSEVKAFHRENNIAGLFFSPWKKRNRYTASCA